MCEMNPSEYEPKGVENPIPHVMAIYPSEIDSLVYTVVFQVYHEDRGASNVAVPDYSPIARLFQMGDINKSRDFDANPCI